MQKHDMHMQKTQKNRTEKMICGSYKNTKWTTEQAHMLNHKLCQIRAITVDINRPKNITQEIIPPKNLQLFSHWENLKKEEKSVIMCTNYACIRSRRPS